MPIGVTNCFIISYYNEKRNGSMRKKSENDIMGAKMEGGSAALH
jgi:hypothetical protein